LFFSKSITDLSSEDLAELLTEAAVENVRLEFKREPPGPDEMLKKLSGFANTFGGYLIVGAAAPSADGRLEAFPGVDPQRNYRQTIIQRCYEGIWPPIEVFVSDGIAAPNAADKVCYVIYVPESWEAPHFLTKRRGAWIRTDEFSQRFETHLATFEEIQHLSNRRRLAVERLEYIHTRAVRRFEALAARKYSEHPRTSGSIGATLFLSLCPQFPTRQLITDRQLLDVVTSVKIPCHGQDFPSGDETITQQDSVLVLHPARVFSLVEANVWGQLMYSLEIEHLMGNVGHQVSGIPLRDFIGHILVFFEHGRTIYRKIGFDGQLLIRLLFKRIQGKPFITIPFPDFPETGPASPIDDEISLDFSCSTLRLTEQRDEVVGDLLRLIFFALNWPQQGADPKNISDLLDAAKDYNSWRQRT